MKLTVVLLTLSCIVCGAQSQSTTKAGTYPTIRARDLLTQAAKNLRQRKSVRYVSEERFKYYSGADTSRTTYQYEIIRNTADSLAGGYLRVVTSDSVDIIRTSSLLAFVQHNKRSITTYDMAKQETWILDQYNDRNRFLHPETLPHILDEYDCLSVADTKFKNEDAYELRLYGKKEVNQDTATSFIRQSRVLVLRKSDLFPVSDVSIHKFQGEYQYSEKHISNIRYNLVRMSDVTKGYPYGYTVKPYKAPQGITGLDTGSVAPIVSGHRVEDGIAGDALDTIRYEGKVTLLDFWYMSCAGCIMAIPALDSLRAELPRDSFQIVSVNSIDGNANGMRRLPNFMKRNPMSTDVLIVEPKVPESFMINLYPRFFIVDGQGIIRYSTAGYYHALQQNLLQAMRKHQHR